MSAVHNVECGEIHPDIIREKNLVERAAKKHIPLTGTFELTPRCSLRCKMCYVRLDRNQMRAIGRELTAREWISLAGEAEKAGTIYILLTGGEPLIREDFEEIYTALCHMGFLITLNTNATLMTPEYLKLFKKYPPQAMMVTLYGASPETYEKVCGDANGFDKTMRGIELLSDVPAMMTLRTTMIQDNMLDLDELCGIARGMGRNLAIGTGVSKAIRGATADAESCRLTQNQRKEINAAHRSIRDLSDDSGSGRENRNDDRLSKLFAGLPPVTLSCAAGKLDYCISWDGKLLPCVMFSSPYTLPLQEGFSQAWKRLPALLEKIPEPADCMSCGLKSSCEKCPARVQAETGKFDQIPTYLCKKSLGST